MAAAAAVVVVELQEGGAAAIEVQGAAVAIAATAELLVAAVVSALLLTVSRLNCLVCCQVKQTQLQAAAPRVPIAVAVAAIAAGLAPMQLGVPAATAAVTRGRAK